MNEGMSDDADALGELAATCRLHGVRRLRITADEFELELYPGAPPKHAATAPEEPALTEEQRARAEHHRKWARITRASGAPIPPFPGDLR